jgi:AAA+ superfamily predicted ATPase
VDPSDSDPLSSTVPGHALSPEIPAWYPAWAKELAELYFSGSVCLFVLHGNVHDLIACRRGKEFAFCNLAEFLAEQVFGTWDVVFAYDLGRGLQVEAGKEAGRRREMVEYASAALGTMSTWPRDPEQVFQVLDRIIERNLMEERPERRKRIAFQFAYAQYLVPSAGLNMMARGEASRLVRLIAWAQNPYIKRINMAFCLIAEKMSELSDRLVQNPHVAAIEIPLPDESARRVYIEHCVAESGVRLGTEESAEELSAEAIARMSNGLNLVNLHVLLSRTRADGRGPSVGQFRQLKKGMIERQCQGLVTFVEPKHTLDKVVGHTAAKERLRQDARWIGLGRLETAPMCYLICGPVGTGKTFLAECYAGSIGIPCVTLANFRSKYVGETEGNLEQVLNVLRSLGPVVVIIDEADAALGNREADGDSGTSGRVFSMIARQMGDTDYRGKIIWMLLTSRPDLLPIDLKRQGRAEVHIPLFYPHDAEEIGAMFRVMAAKNRIQLAPDAAVPVAGGRELSGADIESIVLSARRRVLADGRETFELADLQGALEAFIPSAQGLEKEMQELVAVLECTDREFLPDDWQLRLRQTEGRTRLQERLVELRAMIRQ